MNKTDKLDIVIFYFSGTGNTWWVSQEIVRQLQIQGRKARAFSIETLSSKETACLIEDASIVGFGYPVHGSDLPGPMKSFLSSLPKVKGKEAFIFCTQWLWSGDGAAAGAAFLQGKDYLIKWGEHFLMPNNVTVSIINLPYTNDPERLKTIRSRAQVRVIKLVELITTQKAFHRGFDPLAAVLGSLQRKPFRHFYKQLQNDIAVNEEGCINCGECVRLCPAGNLFYEGQVIKSRGTCVLCLRCYNFCPVAAITYMGRAHRHDRGEPYRGPVEDFYPGVLIEKPLP